MTTIRDDRSVTYLDIITSQYICIRKKSHFLPYYINLLKLRKIKYNEQAIDTVLAQGLAGSGVCLPRLTSLCQQH